VDFPTAIEKYWGQATGIAVGLFAALKWWRDRKSADRAEGAAARSQASKDKLDADRAAREGVAEAIQILRDEVKRLAAEVEDVREELRELQTEHIRMIADKDAEIALLRGRNRQLEATIAAHRRQMIAAGLSVPAEPAFFELREGELKPMGEPQ